MCRRCRYPLILVTLVLVAVSAGAETLAVSVRLRSGPQDDPGVRELMGAVEEGAMDTMFASGHIVFDIDPAEDYRLTRYQAIDIARSGGASFLILIDASFTQTHAGRIMPAVSEVTVVNIRTERDRRLDAVDPEKAPGSADTSPGDLSLGMGAEAAQSALREIGEVESPW